VCTKRCFVSFFFFSVAMCTPSLFFVKTLSFFQPRMLFSFSHLPTHPSGQTRRLSLNVRNFYTPPSPYLPTGFAPFYQDPAPYWLEDETFFSFHFSPLSIDPNPFRLLLFAGPSDLLSTFFPPPPLILPRPSRFSSPNTFKMGNRNNRPPRTLFNNKWGSQSSP